MRRAWVSQQINASLYAAESKFLGGWRGFVFASNPAPCVNPAQKRSADSQQAEGNIRVGYCPSNPASLIQNLTLLYQAS
jgi:hypothetical protein